MRLLGTVLLSTTLMMGVTFGADALPTDESVEVAPHGVERSDAQVFADTLAEIRAENAQYLDMIKKLVSKVHTGAVTATDRGEFVDYIAALAKGLNGALKAKTKLESDLAAATGRVTTVEAANAELTKEKAKTEAALKEASDKLEALTAEKDETSRKLEAATAKVVELTTALETATASAKKDGEDATSKIKELNAGLAAANEQVSTLTDKVAELEQYNRKLQDEIKRVKVDQQRIADELAAAAKARRLAAAEVDLDA